MKRSEINRLIEETKKVLHENNITLPPFAYWGPEDWGGKGGECDEIRKCMLGWDITDFGRGDFSKLGLILFTIRNGNLEDVAKGGKNYCEKIMKLEEGQSCPMHYHFQLE